MKAFAPQDAMTAPMPVSETELGPHTGTVDARPDGSRSRHARSDRTASGSVPGTAARPGVPEPSGEPRERPGECGRTRTGKGIGAFGGRRTGAHAAVQPSSTGRSTAGPTTTTLLAASTPVSAVTSTSSTEKPIAPAPSAPPAEAPGPATSTLSAPLPVVVSVPPKIPTPPGAIIAAPAADLGVPAMPGAPPSQPNAPVTSHADLRPPPPPPPPNGSVAPQTPPVASSARRSNGSLAPVPMAPSAPPPVATPLNPSSAPSPNGSIPSRSLVGPPPNAAAARLDSPPTHVIGPDTAATEVISELPLGGPADTADSSETAAATRGGWGSWATWSDRRKKVAIALGATAGVGIVTAGLALGLHTKDPGAATPVGVVPVTDTGGGLVSGDKPAGPQPAAGPQFAPDSPPPAADPDPTDPLASMPPDPYANNPALKAAPPAALPPPPAVPPSQAGSDGLPPDTLPDDLDDPSQSGTSSLDGPSYGSPNAVPPQYRPAPRHYGPGGYRGPERSNGPLGSLSDRDDRPGGPRRGPVDDAVPGLGGLGGH